MSETLNQIYYWTGLVICFLAFMSAALAISVFLIDKIAILLKVHAVIAEFIWDRAKYKAKLKDLENKKEESDSN